MVIHGAEDEAPVEPGANLRSFCEGGMERLHMASGFVEQCRRSGMGKAFIDRECAKAGDDAAAEVLDLAHALRVRCGKVRSFSIFTTPVLIPVLGELREERKKERKRNKKS